MKAGLFICDHVSAPYQAQFGDYPAMFAQLFPEFEWVHYDVCAGQFPDSLEECDLYLATGSRQSVYDSDEWIVRLKEVVREINRLGKYFVGFCFGHQLMGAALGGRVEKAAGGWCVGVHEFKIVKEQAWMQPVRNSLSLLMMCQDQVVELPEGATLLAGNEHCPVGMFQVGKNMLGIQAHPEFSKAYEQFLLEKRENLLGSALVERAIESLNKEVDATVFHDWVMQFLNRS